MRYWRKIVVFTLILTMPISSWASVMMTPHCHSSNNTSHSMHTQMHESESIHMPTHDQVASQDTSDHPQCDCGCGGEVDCLVFGCSAAALLNVVQIDSIHPTQSMYQGVTTIYVPFDLNSLFRPPISLS